METSAVCGSVNNPFAWYAVRVRTRSELQVAAALDAKGIQSYVPTFSSSRRWADRAKILQTALFPGYVFSRFDVNHRLPVLTTPNVIQILGAGKHPVSVPDTEIASLFLIGAADLPKTAVEMPIAGDKVVIKQGPLSGVEGVLVSAKRGTRLLVNVTILQRAVAVEVELSWISAIPGDQAIETDAAA